MTSVGMKRKIVLSLAATAGLALPTAAATAAALQTTEPPSTEDTVATSEERFADPYQAFWDAGYNYDQLVALANEWEVGVFEAKARASGLILEGRAGEFDALVTGIEETPYIGGTEPHHIGSDETALKQYAAFWDAGYNYDQLLALATEWNVDEFEAKARAGGLILDGRAAEFDALVAGIDETPAG